MWGCPGVAAGVERGGGFVVASGDYEVSADFVAAGVERGGFLGGCCAPSAAKT